MEKYFIGLDIGTNSVGIAATDENYKLLRLRGKDAWAVRLFEEAKTAQERRTKRTLRRRLQRRRDRLDNLQALTAPVMAEEGHDKFFLKINNSPFALEDKDAVVASKYAIFDDDDYTDKDFYKEYPTIFHLRKALMEHTRKADVRLYYLALHHILKYRGHFLFEGEFSAERDATDLFERLNQCLEVCFDEDAVRLDVNLVQQFTEIAKQRKGLRDRESAAYELFGAAKDKRLKELVNLLLGATADVTKIFAVDDTKSKGENATSVKLALSKISDDGELDTALVDLPEEQKDAMVVAKQLYDFLVFKKTLGDNKYISDAMVGIYEKHMSDLKKLKKLVKTNCAHSVYYEIFKKCDDKTTNYCAYVGYSKCGSKKTKVKKCSKEEFEAFLKKILTKEAEKLQGEPEYDEIMADLEQSNFLPKILFADGGKFPYQINKAELLVILQNAEKDYPQFASVSDGLTVSQKIVKLMEFRIPYYVGPLNAHNATDEKGAWVVRKQQGKVYPWNFEEMVDLEKSNERFIRRMTNKCSYLKKEDVLPKASVYYQKYDVLNQLNKLKLKGVLIPVELKKQIFNQLFCVERRVTKKRIAEFLVNCGVVKKGEIGAGDVSVGNDDELTASMSTYVTMKSILGEFVDKRPDVVEEIVLLHTLNTDKLVVEKALRNKYGDVPEVMNALPRLRGLNFKDFGRLSKKLLVGLKGGLNPDTGEYQYNLLETLYNTNQNFNEILYDERHRFGQLISDENTGASEQVTYADVEELYVSPAVRRSVWQALRMVDEYVEAKGDAPEKIFVEVTRAKEKDPKKKDSRRKKIEQLFENCKKDCADIDRLRRELNEKSDLDLRSDRLFLYFTQLGRCMYTNEKIDLGLLSSDTYDIDHIIPRSLKKDDSLDNRVLVERKANAEKADDYPIRRTVIEKMKGFWNMLKAKELISNEKYNRLVRTDELTTADYNEFIARQLVVTGQAEKAVAELLQRKYGPCGTKVVYSKAVNVDDFKQRFDIVKCREVNDLHHARDAYLNVVAGNVYDVRFGGVRQQFATKVNSADQKTKVQQNRDYNLNSLFFVDVNSAWKAALTKRQREQGLTQRPDGQTPSIEVVRSVLSRNSMAVTYYATTGKGGFYKETIYSSDNGAKIARKQMRVVNGQKRPSPFMNVEKYGGYTAENCSYLAVVSFTKKGRQTKKICPISVLENKQIENRQRDLQTILEEKLKTKSVEVICEKLKLNSLVEINGTKFLIKGSEDIRIFVQWFVENRIEKYIKKLAKIQKEYQQHVEDDVLEKYEISLDRNMAVYEAILQQLSCRQYKGATKFVDGRKQLIDKQVVFSNLSLYNQTTVLLKLIGWLSGSVPRVDLSKEMGLSSGFGRQLLPSAGLFDSFYVIDQSPCGLTVRRRKL